MKETISHRLWPNLSFPATSIFVSWSDLLVLCGCLCAVAMLCAPCSVVCVFFIFVAARCVWLLLAHDFKLG